MCKVPWCHPSPKYCAHLQMFKKSGENNTTKSAKFYTCVIFAVKFKKKQLKIVNYVSLFLLTTSLFFLQGSITMKEGGRRKNDSDAL